MNSNLRTARLAFRLARWLGPWTRETQIPSGVSRREVYLPAKGTQRPFLVHTYHPPRTADGALLVLPGLHYLGPVDPRLDRFCRILAHAGYLVLSPLLPDFAQMRVEPSLGKDAERAFDALLALPERPRGILPGILSISFGSLPALEVAARRKIGALFLFGGYADYRDAIQFSLSGAPQRPHDPLHRCIVFMNLIEHLPARNSTLLNDTWFQYVRETWGRPAMKQRTNYEALALRLAEHVDPNDRELFLVGTGTGVLEKGEELVETYLPQKEVSHLDPLPWAREVRCPTTIVHGRNDDVIPFEHAGILADTIIHSRCWLTGLYAHSGHASLIQTMQKLPQEGEAFVQILRAMTQMGCQPFS